MEDGKEEGEWKSGRWEGGGMEGWKMGRVEDGKEEGEWEVVFVRFRFRVIL